MHTPAQSLEPADVLADLNQRFHAVTLTGNFVTMFLGLLDQHQQTLHYASAGHEIGSLVPRSGPLDPLMPTGLILGIAPESEFETTQLKLHPNDTVLLLTDGHTETMSSAGTLLGRQAVTDLLSDLREQPATQIVDRLLQLAGMHRHAGRQTDDISLTLLRA